MSHLGIELLIGSTLCLVHLCIGLAIGWRLGRVMSPVVLLQTGDSLELNSSRSNESQQVHCQLEDMRQRLNEIASLALQPAPREVLAKWVADLGQLTNELRQRLADIRGCGVDPPTSPQPCSHLHSGEIPVLEERSCEVMTNAEIVELCDALSRNKPHADEPVVRYKFSVKQPLAGYSTSGKLTYYTVQCHDLSVKEVRYFVDEPPIEERVVLGIGLPSPVKWLVAEVGDCRSAFMYGRIGHLVTARLINSIDHNPRVASQEHVESAGDEVALLT